MGGGGLVIAFDCLVGRGGIRIPVARFAARFASVMAAVDAIEAEADEVSDAVA